jgi:hypothetical protein
MSESRTTPEEIYVSATEDLEDKTAIERKLTQIYGSGTYLSDFYVTEDGTISVQIGNSFPKDVTDCRPGEERVIKFIDIDDIAELSGYKHKDGYKISLSSREEVSEALQDKKEQLRENLSNATVRATYDKIAQTPAVENQLTPIKQILRWTRLYHPAPFKQVKKAQDKDEDKTYRYVETLETLGFVRFDGENIYAKDPLDKYDLEEISTEKFNEKILAEVVERGYKHLSEQLGLNILRHLPKFANSYYFDAVEKNDPNLHLDLEAIRSNIRNLYGYQSGLHEWVLRDKMDELVSLGILSNDEEYYYADRNTFQEIAAQASAKN